MSTLWTVADGLAFVACLSSLAEPRGYGVGLCGSVARGDASTKDLDVILFPLRKPRVEDGDMARVEAGRASHDARSKMRVALLRLMGMERVRTVVEVQAAWLAKYESRDAKLVEEWAYEGKRVDVFWLA